MFRLNRQPSLPSRLIATLGVALVLLLNVLATSPELHARLHALEQPINHAGHDQDRGGDADDGGCVVTLFAHGITALVFFCLLVRSGLLIRNPPWRASERLAAPCLRYWLAPSQAPPRA